MAYCLSLYFVWNFDRRKNQYKELSVSGFETLAIPLESMIMKYVDGYQATW